MAIVLAVFLGLVASEFYFGKKLGITVYRFRDSASHLAIGLGQQVTNFAVMGLLAAAFAAIQSRFGILHFDETAKWQWAAVILIADFTYYFAHRLGHRMNLFIIPHSVHHQARDYNYISALRLPWMNRVIMFVFYVPLAIIGIPPKMMLSAFVANLLVGTFAHNGVIRRRLGFLEYVFVTPRSHYVHHGVNGKYLDKNFGGVFSIWDRIFGTYVDLDEKVPVVLPGAESEYVLDPVDANFDYLRKVAFVFARRESIIQKFRTLLDTPEILAEDLARFGFVEGPRSSAPEVARPGDRIRMTVAFFAATGVSLTLLNRGASLPLVAQLAMAVAVFVGSSYIGRLLRRVPADSDGSRESIPNREAA